MSKPRDIEERFWSKVQKADGDACWEWLGWKNHHGYGGFNVGKGQRWQLAHRWLFQRLHGPLDRWTLVCHRCDNPTCVRSDHLFAGSPLDNTRDSLAKGRRGGKATPRHLHPSEIRSRRPRGPHSRLFCKQGHRMSPDNVIVGPNGGSEVARRCRTCRRENMKTWNRKDRRRAA